MTDILTPEFWGRFFGIVGVNLLLSGDNAVVIALAVRRLAPRQQLLGRIWGTVGAVILRIAFIAVVTYLAEFPGLKVVGGVLLLWIAFNLIQPDTGEIADVKHGTSMLHAVWIILVADVTMSLDNVLAVVAVAKGNLVLVAFGIALSVPIVVVGAGILAWLMNRYGWIVWLGGGLLGFVAGDMILQDKILQARLPGGSGAWHYPLTIGIAAVLTALGWWLARTAPAEKKVPENV